MNTNGERAVQVAPAEAYGRDWSKVRGFNYQPSYGRNGMEIWTRFDAELIATELARGKAYFPGMNSVRIWLPWDVYRRDAAAFSANLETYLTIIDDLGWTAMPILFNRWYGLPEFGAITLDHFMPGSLIRTDQAIVDYVDAVVGRYADDPRILAWDLCNEPFMTRAAYGEGDDETPAAVDEAETEWLRVVHGRAKATGARQPLTIATWGRHSPARFDEFSDILTTHPYYWPRPPENTTLAEQELIPNTHEGFAEMVDGHVAFALSVGKPIVATECCIGPEDDATRAESVRVTLETLRSRGIGWMPHLLHHSLVADAHRAEFGEFSGAYMGFIEADGSLRPGHGIYNDY